MLANSTLSTAQFCQASSPDIGSYQMLVEQISLHTDRDRQGTVTEEPGGVAANNLRVSAKCCEEADKDAREALANISHAVA